MPYEVQAVSINTTFIAGQKKILTASPVTTAQWKVGCMICHAIL